MSEEEPKLLCYNRGCGQEFKESENRFDSCRFHPGTHFFHDAYKGWTCCRKTVNFTEFLNMKGCATGHHTNVKPPEPEKKQEQVVSDEIIEVCRPKYVAKPRPAVDAPLLTIQPTLSDSLKKQTYELQASSRDDQQAVAEITVGITKCVNKGCTKLYDGPQTDAETCKFHPGVPIFHEGLKYWSCCQKKTTEFDVFMKQEGCQTGSHVWVKPKEASEFEGGPKVMKCRHDWHQDGSFVHVVIYGGGKKFDPSKSRVQAHGIKLNVELSFPEEHSLYKETWILAGIIVPEESTAFMTPMKIEIKLKKAEPVYWSNLNIPDSTLRSAAKGEENAEEHKNVGVDPVDLSDL